MRFVLRAFACILSLILVLPNHAICASANKPVSQATQAPAIKQQISVISSSSIYQFALIVVEEFASTSKFRSPMVEPIGTGMGFKQFCSQANNRSIDIVFASRQMRQSEFELCKKNQIGNISSVQIGYDAIVLVTNKDNVLENLNRSVLFRAMGKNVPNKNSEWGVNGYKRWSEIDEVLPPISIEFYAPSVNTSSSDVVAELILVDNCIHICCPELSYSMRHAHCKEFREDKRYTIGNDDAKLMIKKLQANKEAVGIMTYNSYMENTDSIKVIAVDGIEPTRANIANGLYNVRRPLWVYVRADNVNNVKGLKEFIEFITDKNIVGKNGLLTKSGLISVIE